MLAGSLALLGTTTVFCAADDAVASDSDATVAGGGSVYSIAVSGAS